MLFFSCLALYILFRKVKLVKFYELYYVSYFPTYFDIAGAKFILALSMGRMMGGRNNLYKVTLQSLDAWFFYGPLVFYQKGIFFTEV